MIGYCDSDIQQIASGLGEDVQEFAGRSVLLCGGHGFLGRYYIGLFKHLNKHVLRNPCRLVVLDNQLTSGQRGPDQSECTGYDFLERDVIQPIELDKPIDYIIHAAGIASPYYYRKYPLETLEVATVGTRRLLQLGHDRHVKGFLFFSSSEIYGDPDERHVPTPESYRGNVSCLGPRACYDESKRLGETLCMIFHEVYEVPTKIVRPFNVYGPGMSESDYRVLPNFASRIVGGRSLNIYGSGKQTRTFCYVTDALVGFTKVLLNGVPGQAYNIGNPVPEISMGELAHLAEQIAGRKLERQLVEYPDSYPADEPQRRCPDITKAARQLGFHPRVNLEEGVRQFLEWASQNYTGTEL